ncbi:protein bicaudal C homolog 1 isoform X2 [Planococcus citri]|uniref:protein bicaudal C homolog 1 isoform X2 n=1 Tax=Planococcus citri TaxID=170843 RepID=UPI0031F9DA1C
MRPNSNAASDTLSEISEASTTGTERSSCYSSDYRDELQEFATSLGFNNVKDLPTERFRVNRKKLELMLLGKADCAKSAQEFFEKIMKETKTLILWPSRLKIGAKSKKDPHIKIAGLMNNVKSAKEQVMAVLDTRVPNIYSNRVTMKLDVSYTDHSHIIGKGGSRIKKVMEETSCHIHFPDSNRSNEEEKSNQVSIAGEMANIEKARARVRELTPLIFCFELPNVGTIQQFPEQTSSIVLSTIQENYNVQVMFRTRAKLHSTLVMVKGCELDMRKVKEATLSLISLMCGKFASSVKIQMMMEISPQYHSLVLGANHQNLKTIMQRTRVQVMFPDPRNPCTPSLKKSSVTITGSSIDDVYLARQMLLGSLPLVLMFDLTSEVVSLNPETLDEIMQSLDVYISIRFKHKQNIYSVVIKGLERNATNIYEARRILTGSRDKPIKAVLPSTYKAPGAVPSFLKSFATTGSFQNLPSLPIGNNRTGFPHLQQTPHSVFIPSFFSPITVLGTSFQTPTNSPRPLRDTTPDTSFESPTDTGTAIKIPQNNSTSCDVGLLSSMRLPYSFSLPDVRDSLTGHSSLSSNTSSLSSPAASPRTTSPSQSLMENKLDISDDRKAPGFERSIGNIGLPDLQNLRIKAAQAMQGVPSRTQVRIPTTTWSGYGFSQSSPSSMLRNQKKEEVTNTEEEINSNTKSFFNDSVDSNSQNFSASNYLDAAASTTFNVVTSSNYHDLPVHLASLGLQKYIQLFKSHEIDLSTFQTLTEADLREIGVHALGARKKMMLFISELKKRENLNVFRGSAAPGAERKSSTSTSSPQNDSW